MLRFKKTLKTVFFKNSLKISISETRLVWNYFIILEGFFKNSVAICSFVKILTGQVYEFKINCYLCPLFNLAAFHPFHLCFLLVKMLSVEQMATEFFKNSRDYDLLNLNWDLHGTKEKKAFKLMGPKLINKTISKTLLIFATSIVEFNTNKSEVCRFYLYWRIIRSIDFFEANFLT